MHQMSQTTTLRITGMSCQNCVKHVHTALSTVRGVESVQVSLETGEAVVAHNDKTQTADLIQIVTEEGYGAELIA
jgi:copper chaperone CopZ